MISFKIMNRKKLWLENRQIKNLTDFGGLEPCVKLEEALKYPADTVYTKSALISG